MSFDLNQFKKGLIYKDQASFADIRSAIEEIRKLDHETESFLAKLKMAMIIAGIATVASVCLLPLAIVSGAVLVVCAVIFFQTKQTDLPNRRYEFASEVLNALSRDMLKDGQFKLTLDLAPPNKSHKKTETEKVRGWDVTYFEDPWLQIEGRFKDGTQFEVSMVDKFQSRTKWARSSSGKSKRKSKTKSATLASVKLFPKLKKYSQLEKVAAQTPRLLKLPTWVKIKKVSAEPDALGVTTITTENWSVKRFDPKTSFDGPEIVFTSLLSLYQVLHASKTVRAE